MCNCTQTKPNKELNTVAYEHVTAVKVHLSDTAASSFSDSQLYLHFNVCFLGDPGSSLPMDNIWAIITVWGKIIITVLCFIVYDISAHRRCHCHHHHHGCYLLSRWGMPHRCTIMSLAASSFPEISSGLVWVNMHAHMSSFYSYTHTHTHNRFTALLKYVRDHPGEQVPER